MTTRSPEDCPRTIFGIGAQYYQPNMKAAYTAYPWTDSIMIAYRPSYGATGFMRFMSKNQRFGTELSVSIAYMENPSPDKVKYPDDQTALMMPLQINEDWYIINRSFPMFMYVGIGLGYVYWEQYSYDMLAQTTINTLLFTLRGGLGVRLSYKTALEFSYAMVVGGKGPLPNLQYNYFQVAIPFAF